MATLLAPADVRTLVETDLSDTALQLLLDDADAAIVDLYGEHTSQVDTIEAGTYDPLTASGLYGGEDYVYGRDMVIFPSRQIQSVTSITEQLAETITTLDPSDYRLLSNGFRVLRLGTGANPRIYWGHRVVLTYTPVDQTSQRKRVELDLVKLAIQYNALTQEKIGDWQGQMPNYEAERVRLLSALEVQSWA